MSQQAFGVYPQLPEPSPPTHSHGVRAYLDHLLLRVQSDDFSQDAFLNIQRNLVRYEQAWSVRTADRRQWLVPQAEPEWVTLANGRRQKRRKLKYQAATAEEAIREAARIAEAQKGPTLGGLLADVAPVVRRNGERAVGEASNDDLARWLLANPQWKSGHSKHDALTAIVGCFAWFEEEFKVPSPYRRKRLPKIMKKPRREAKTGEYVALMRHSSSRPLRRALWCLWNVQGIRPCSMRQMRWSDFNWEGGFALTYRHKTARATNRPFLVVFTARQLRFFRNLYRQRPPWPDEVFLNSDGRAWKKNTFSLHLRRTAERIGLDDGVADRVSAYCLRHSFATQADEAGAPRADTALLMGHSDERMIRDVYSKASSKVSHVRGAAERMERLRLQARRAGKAAKKPERREEGPELF